MQLPFFINISLLLIATPIAFLVCFYASKTIVIGVLDYAFPSKSIEITVQTKQSGKRSTYKVDDAKELAEIINNGSFKGNGKE
ncbi:hypothetical protein BM526_08215 [Alteromonas mediterranea]|uniref:hypothetical protein n=1 Tax=Alteromonas mediterranea TaxID=314275 RepID=UPI0009033C6B|nr:hypothetical protein [Alteromonas mediterranea]APE01824.1 hypothetical protein BM526_08215 [Alteromonas mediterranea]